MESFQNKVEAVLNGKIRIRRFTAEEQSGSSDTSDRFLWTGILLAEAELVAADGGILCAGAAEEAGDVACPARFLKGLSAPLPTSFEALAADLGRYADRGQESVIFDAGDGYVNKLRLMRPSILTGYLAPLANIVYHNRLFSADRYTLEGIYSKGESFFMLLRQPLVRIRLQKDGFPVRPSASQVRAAIDSLAAGLVEYEESVDDSFDSSDSDDSEDDNPAKLRFYNADYFISDLQPGRNVVIDDDTGAVRFIDPRITLNDPQGPTTRVSRFGRRTEALPGQMI